MLTRQPTWGAIAWDGLSHYSTSNDTIGFFSRCVEDLELLADVFKLTDIEPTRGTLSVEKTRIAFAKTHVWPKAGPGLKEAWEKAKLLLVRHGADVEEIELPEDFAKVEDWKPPILVSESRASFLGSKCHPVNSVHCRGTADEQRLYTCQGQAGPNRR